MNVRNHSLQTMSDKQVHTHLQSHDKHHIWKYAFVTADEPRSLVHTVPLYMPHEWRWNHDNHHLFFISKSQWPWHHKDSEICLPRLTHGPRERWAAVVLYLEIIDLSPHSSNYIYTECQAGGSWSHFYGLWCDLDGTWTHNLPVLGRHSTTHTL